METATIENSLLSFTLNPILKRLISGIGKVAVNWHEGMLFELDN